MRRIALLALTLAACATARPAWVPSETVYAAPRAGFEVAVPSGWMQRNLRERELLFVTRDGTSLQSIRAGSAELGKPLSRDTTRSITAGMSPQEAADAVIDDLNATRSWAELKIVENAPAKLAGRDGFRVLAAYRDASGRKMRIAIYGVTNGARFYWLSYIAPERHYYELDLPTFEQMARSFRLTAQVPSA